MGDRSGYPIGLSAKLFDRVIADGLSDWVINRLSDQVISRVTRVDWSHMKMFN
jgi:hypothetical protein